MNWRFPITWTLTKLFWKIRFRIKLISNYQNISSVLLYTFVHPLRLKNLIFSSSQMLDIKEKTSILKVIKVIFPCSHSVRLPFLVLTKRIFETFSFVTVSTCISSPLLGPTYFLSFIYNKRRHILLCT